MPSQVPEDGLKAAMDAQDMSKSEIRQCNPCRDCMRVKLQAFLDWQAANPRVPTDAEALDIYCGAPSERIACAKYISTIWIRRMYIAPEVPPEIAHAQLIDLSQVKDQAELDRLVRETQLECFNIGRQVSK